MRFLGADPQRPADEVERAVMGLLHDMVMTEKNKAGG